MDQRSPWIVNVFAKLRVQNSSLGQRAIWSKAPMFVKNLERVTGFEPASFSKLHHQRYELIKTVGFRVIIFALFHLAHGDDFASRHDHQKLSEKTISVITVNFTHSLFEKRRVFLFPSCCDDTIFCQSVPKIFLTAAVRSAA